MQIPGPAKIFRRAHNRLKKTSRRTRSKKFLIEREKRLLLKCSGFIFLPCRRFLFSPKSVAPEAQKFLTVTRCKILI